MQILKKLQILINAKEEEEVPAHHIIAGQNVMLRPVRDGQQFVLDLMTMMFKKEEMAGHLWDMQIEKIVGLVLERFPRTNMKNF